MPVSLSQASCLQFYTQVPANSYLGKAAFKRLDADPPNGVKIRLEFSGHGDFFTGGRKAHWVWLTAKVWNQRVPARSFGQVAIDVLQRPPLQAGTAGGEVEWLWRLTPLGRLGPWPAVPVSHEPKAIPATHPRSKVSPNSSANGSVPKLGSASLIHGYEVVSVRTYPVHSRCASWTVRTGHHFHANVYGV